MDDNDPLQSEPQYDFQTLFDSNGQILNLQTGQNVEMASLETRKRSQLPSGS